MKPNNVKIVGRSKNVIRVLRIKHIPATIAIEQLEKTIAEPFAGYQGSVVLSATSKDQRVALRHVHVIEHCNRQAVAAAGPRRTAILADIKAAVVPVVYKAVCRRGH